MTHTRCRWLVLGLLVTLAAGCSSEAMIDGRTISEWVNLLRHQDYGMQQQAQEALARHGEGSIPYLKRALRTTDSTMRRNAARTLARMGATAKPAVAELIARLGREKVALLRAEYLLAMAAIDPADASVKEQFEKRLRDVDEEVRQAAQAGLDRTDPEKQKPAPAPEPLAPVDDSLLLKDRALQALRQKRPGVQAGLVAEVARGERRAAIVWPGLDAGKALDDDLVALVFGRQGESDWALLQEVGALRGEQGSARLSEGLGGADGQRVVRSCGVPREELAAYLQTWGKAFGQAQAAGEGAKAMEAYEKLAQAFAFPLVVFDDALQEMLLKGGLDEPWKLTPQGSGDSLEVEMTHAGQVRKGRVVLRPCGQGVVISELRPATDPPKSP